MPRLPGTPKTGGRIKGTPNRRTFDLADQLEEVGLNVPGEIAARLPKLADSEAVEALIELMSFLYPKRKAIEHAAYIQQVQSSQPKQREIEDEDLRNDRVAKGMVRLMELDADLTYLVAKGIESMNDRLLLNGETLELLKNTKWRDPPPHYMRQKELAASVTQPNLTEDKQSP